MKKLWLVIALCVAIVSVITLSPHAAPESGWSDTLRGVFDSNVSAAIIAEPVDLSGTIKTGDDTDICAMVLASGQFMFSCNPRGVLTPRAAT